MILCPKCGGRLRVIDSLKDDAQGTYRRRRDCLNKSCPGAQQGGRVSVETVETIDCVWTLFNGKRRGRRWVQQTPAVVADAIQ